MSESVVRLSKEFRVFEEFSMSYRKVPWFQEFRASEMKREVTTVVRVSDCESTPSVLILLESISSSPSSPGAVSLTSPLCSNCSIPIFVVVVTSMTPFADVTLTLDVMKSSILSSIIVVANSLPAFNLFVEVLPSRFGVVVPASTIFVVVVSPEVDGAGLVVHAEEARCVFRMPPPGSVTDSNTSSLPALVTLPLPLGVVAVVVRVSDCPANPGQDHIQWISPR